MGKKIPGDILRYMVLGIFDEGPSYGYEVVSRIEDVTEGHWSPSYGTIYPLIQRLEDEGLLRELDEEELEERELEGEDRNYFEITEKGRENFCFDKENDEHRRKFEDLIIGYLKIYENTYSSESLNELFQENLDLD